MLDTIYKGQERECSSVSKSDQLFTWVSMYSLFYINVYITAHITVYNALYNNNLFSVNCIVQFTVHCILIKISLKNYKSLLIDQF